MIPADKSVAQRALLFSLLSNEPCFIKGFLGANDSLTTLNFIKLFADVSLDKDLICVKNQRFLSLKKPNIYTKRQKKYGIKRQNKYLQDLHLLSHKILSFDCENSGTLLRLASGLLAGSKHQVVLSGDESLSKRPIKRIKDPLKLMKARIYAKSTPPVFIKGGLLRGQRYKNELVSAQVKSAFILAALLARKKSYYKEKSLSRNHSEILLKKLGVNIKYKNNTLLINPLKAPIKGFNLTLPKDPSAAFYPVLATIITKGNKIELKDILYNKTRLEGYKILIKMGANITIIPTSSHLCTITATSSSLKGIELFKNIAWLIDELPALFIAFMLANSKSTLKNARELRVKESDRLSVMAKNLALCGAKVSEYEDGLCVSPGVLRPAFVHTHGDHRVAMSFLVLSLLADIKVDDEDCVKSSFADFKEYILAFKRGDFRV